MKRRWTAEEIEILKAHYKNGGCEKTLEHLSRTNYSIWHMARRIGLKADPSIAFNKLKEYHRTHDQHGENNPNWKNGIAKNNMHYKRLQIERYPERVRAREIVRNAIKSGKLKKECCEVCKKEEVQAHHDDYTKPLQVHWLCKKHHDELHKKLLEQAV